MFHRTAVIGLAASLIAAVSEKPPTEEQIAARQELELRGGRRLVFTLTNPDASPTAMDQAAIGRVVDIVGRRFRDLLDRAVLVHAAGASLTVDVPKSAADELARLDRELGENGSLAAVLQPGHFELALVDDRDETLARLSEALPRRIKLLRDHVPSEAGALQPPYLHARDRDPLEEFAKGRAPPGRKIGIQPAQGGGFRTVMLEEPVLDGASIVDAFVIVVDGVPRSLKIRFDERGAALLHRMTADKVGRRLTTILDGTVGSVVVVAEAVTSGWCQLHLDSAKPPARALLDARNLTVLLRSGELPRLLWLKEDRAVPPKGR